MYQRVILLNLIDIFPKAKMECVKVFAFKAIKMFILSTFLLRSKNQMKNY